MKEDVGQLAFARGRENLVGAASHVGVHAHIQRRGLSERESAFRIVKLHRRNSQIEENTVDRVDRASVEDVG